MIEASRFMSLILRHQPQTIGIELEQNGWADTNALIEGMNRAGHRVTLEHLEEIVMTNDKQRFKFNNDHTKIRANQGHSVNVDVELHEATPPAVLYHGTATRFIQAIRIISEVFYISKIYCPIWINMLNFAGRV